MRIPEHHKPGPRRDFQSNPIRMEHARILSAPSRLPAGPGEGSGHPALPLDRVTVPGAIGDGSNPPPRQPARRDLNRRVVSPAVPRPMAPSTHEAGSGIARVVPLTWITYGLAPED